MYSRPRYSHVSRPAWLGHDHLLTRLAHVRRLAHLSDYDWVEQAHCPEQLRTVEVLFLELVRPSRWPRSGRIDVLPQRAWNDLDDTTIGYTLEVDRVRLPVRTGGICTISWSCPS